MGSYSETKRRTTTLNANSQTTITFNGYNPATIGDVTITVTADSSGEVTESKEDDNVLEKIQTVYYNGYKGKRFTSGSDLNTQAGPFEGHYGIVYSPGNSAYNAAGWTSKTSPGIPVIWKFLRERPSPAPGSIRVIPGTRRLVESRSGR